MTSPNELPRPLFFLLFEEEEEGSLPLVVEMGGRSTVPLFASRNAARTFADSMELGEDFQAIEVSQGTLIEILEDLTNQIEYVALNPPPESAEGMKVQMSSAEEARKALGLNRNSRVLLFNCEGVTDSEAYRRVMEEETLT